MSNQLPVHLAMQRLLGPVPTWIQTRYGERMKHLYYFNCPKCDKVCNSRADENVAYQDALAHIEEAHSSLLRKHLRDVERTVALGREP